MVQWKANAAFVLDFSPVSLTASYVAAFQELKSQ